VNQAEKLIAERQKFVEKVIRFVHDLLTAKGKVLKHETHSSHMYSLRELEFEGFRFRDEGSFTMFGGDEVTIYFQGWRVFEVEYHDMKEVSVKEFDLTMPCPDWQTPLKKLMRLGIPRIAAKIDRAKAKVNVQYLKDIQIGTAQKQLRKEMERLRLVN
jgi:hypothetical protein